jgi:hypothetical protein
MFWVVVPPYTSVVVTVMLYDPDSNKALLETTNWPSEFKPTPGGSVDEVALTIAPSGSVPTANTSPFT